MYCGRPKGVEQKRECDCRNWKSCIEKMQNDTNYAICCPTCQKYRDAQCEYIQLGTSSPAFEKLIQLFYNKLSEPDRFRIILFIGAGASASAGVKTSAQIKDSIARTLNISNKDVLKKFLRYYPDLALSDSIDDTRISMEMLLAAAAQKEGRDRIIEILRNEFPRADSRLAPSHGYEVLSHLVRHNVIDAVISTNYDELFEKSLYDEVGTDHVLHIVGDADFDRVPYLEERAGRKVFKVIKPHGTVSVPNFMQFTIDDVMNLSEAKFGYLRELLSDDKTHIIFVGYRNSDQDIQKLLSVASKKMNEVYWVLRSSTRPYVTNNSGIFPFLKAANSLDNRIIYSAETDVFDDFMSNIVTGINEKVAREIKFQNFIFLDRHVIRGLFLKGAQMDDTVNNKFIMEVIVYALKAKGAFYIDSLLDCQRLSNYSSTLPAETNANMILENMVDLGILEKHNDLLSFAIPSSSLENPSHKIWNDLEGLLKCSLEPELRCRLGNTFIKLSNEFSIDILPENRFLTFRFRRDSQIVPNHVRFALETHEILKNTLRANGEVKIITEAGRWLINEDVMDIIKPYGKNIKVLLSSRPKLSGGSDTLKILKELNCRIRFSHPSCHVEHMTIGDSRAIYFARRERSTSICPIVVADKFDIRDLEKRFKDLWDKGLGIEMKNFWEPFINDKTIIAIGTREWKYYDKEVEGQRGGRPGKRTGIAESDYEANYAITNFLSPLNAIIEQRKMAPVEELSENDIYNIFKERNNFIVIGAVCINWLAGEFWSYYKNGKQFDWNRRDTMKKGFVFREAATKMERESIQNIFYERTNGNSLGIVEYDEHGTEKKCFGYLRDKNVAKDCAVVVKAPHPLYEEKRVLLIMGFSDLGTQYAAALITGGKGCGNVNPEDEVRELNRSEVAGRIEGIVCVERKNDVVETKVERKGLVREQ